MEDIGRSPALASPGYLLIVLEEPAPEEGFDLNASLECLRFAALGDGVYLVPDDAVIAARAVVTDIRRRGGLVLFGRGSVVREPPPQTEGKDA
jgi:hypothetical protein